jgi:shikimate kinase
MLNLYFSDGSSLKLDQSKFKKYSEIKFDIFKSKYNLDLKQTDDITLITYGKVILDNDIYNCINNQTFLVKINIDIELYKILNDERLIKLLANKDARALIYDILNNPKLLDGLKKYKYQKELDIILNMGLPSTDEQIKILLDTNYGNTQIVINTILNL